MRVLIGMNHDDRALTTAPQRTLTLATTSSHPGLPTATLAPYLVPQRAGDPLGLGVTQRPPAPADPDVHDIATENAEFARSLLSDKERRELDEDIAREGFMSIAEVRAIILKNTSKESLEHGALDPEMLAMIDSRINYKLFIDGDNIYTREELYTSYPFHEFGVQPEAIFVGQEIGVFPPRATALTEDLEYVVRDVGDESVEFVMIEDLVRAARSTAAAPSRAPIRIVRTKVYVGKERWEDFKLMQRLFRGAARVAAAQIAYSGGSGGSGGAPPLLTMLAGGLSGGSGPLQLTDAGTAERERVEREERLQRREAEAARALEEATRLAEEAQRTAAATEARLAADIARIERMMRAMGGTTTSAATQKDVESVDADSVPL